MDNKLFAILITIIGIVWLLPLLGVDQLEIYGDWIIGLAFLVMGIFGLIKAFKK